MTRKSQNARSLIRGLRHWPAERPLAHSCSSEASPLSYAESLLKVEHAVQSETAHPCYRLCQREKSASQLSKGSLTPQRLAGLETAPDAHRCSKGTPTLRMGPRQPAAAVWCAACQPAPWVSPGAGQMSPQGKALPWRPAGSWPLPPSPPLDVFLSPSFLPRPPEMQDTAWWSRGSHRPGFLLRGPLGRAC